MFINNFDPVAFQVFSLEIRWYSLSYVVGLIIGWIYCNKFLIKDQAKKNHSKRRGFKPAHRNIEIPVNTRKFKVKEESTLPSNKVKFQSRMATA